MTIPVRPRPILIAIFGIGLVALALLFLKIPGHVMTIRTYLHDTYGLKRGSPVWVDGIEAGSVTAINLRPDLRNEPIEILMRIEKPYDRSIPIDSLALPSSEGVLGPVGIDIETNNTHGALVANGAILTSKEVTGNQAARVMQKIGNILIDASKDMQKTGNSPQ